MQGVAHRTTGSALRLHCTLDIVEITSKKKSSEGVCCLARFYQVPDLTYGTGASQGSCDLLHIHVKLRVLGWLRMVVLSHLLLMHTLPSPQEDADLWATHDSSAAVASTAAVLITVRE